MQGTVSITVQETNLKWSIPDGPEPVVLGRQAHWFPAQGLAQINPLSLPLDLSVGPNPAHRRPGVILWGTHPTGIWSRRRVVASSWGLLAQGFMGPFLVVAGTKGVEGSLLPLPGTLGRTGCLRLQRPMESLQPPVLFRMSGLNALWEDPQLKPPHCQGRQSAQTYAGKGWTVVATDGSREAVLPEGSLQNLSHLRTSWLTPPRGICWCATGGVSHGQRVDAHSVPSAKPTLEVDTPQVVGLLRWCKGLAPRRCPATSLAPSNQPSTVQQVPNRAWGRPGNRGFPVLQPGYQLFGPPGRVCLPGHNQALRYRPLHLIGMLVGGPAQVSQSIPASGLEALDPFIAGLAADSKGSAQFHEAFSPCSPLLHEPDLLSFTARTLPGHHFPPQLSSSQSSRKVLPMFPVFMLPVYPVCTSPQSSPTRGEEDTCQSVLDEVQNDQCMS